MTLCKECISWATEEKRIFLRQALEARLIGLYYDTGNFQVEPYQGFVKIVAWVCLLTDWIYLTSFRPP